MYDCDNIIIQFIFIFMNAREVLTMLKMQIIWAVFIILALVIEGLTTALVSVWFVPGAIAALLLASFKVALWIQVLVFVLVSVVCVVLARVVFKKYFKKKNTLTNIDAIIGEKALVTEKISNLAGCGLVKVKGQLWSARSADPEATYESGEVVTVVAIEGVKLVCK